MCAGGVGIGLGVAGCLLLCVFGWIGFDAYRLYEVKPCVEEGKAKVESLKELPDKYKQETKGYTDELKALKDKASAKVSKLTHEAGQAAMHFDLAKAKELKKEASDEMAEDKKEQSTITGKIKAVPSELKEETCGDGEAIPGQFQTCLDYLSGNIIYMVLAPKGMPKSEDLKPYIDKAAGLVSSAGCGSAASLAALLSAGDMLSLSAQTSSGVLFLAAMSFTAMAASFMYAAGRRGSMHALSEPLVMP